MIYAICNKRQCYSSIEGLSLNKCDTLAHYRLVKSMNISTTMGILQPQVGKSGDILLKFERKNGGEGGIRTRGKVSPTTV